MDVVTYALLKKKINGVVGGISGYEIDGLTLKITTSDGQVLEMTFPEPEDGVSITDVDINKQNHLMCTMSDGTEIDAGEIKTIQGPKGDTGNSGVYLGTEEPDDPEIKVWIDPDGEGGVAANQIIFADKNSLQDKYDNGDLKGEKGDPGAIKYKVVSVLPNIDIEEDTLYLVPNEETEEEDEYIEYVYANGKWEKLGKTVKIDLSNYTTKTEVNSAINDAKTELNINIETAKNDLNASIDSAKESIQTLGTRVEELETSSATFATEQYVDDTFLEVSAQIGYLKDALVELNGEEVV